MSATATESQETADNDARYARLQYGGQEARDEMILANQGLAVSLVKSFTRGRSSAGRLTPDLVGAAYLALTRGADRLATLARQGEPCPNPTAYLSACIRRGIRKEFRKNRPRPDHGDLAELLESDEPAARPDGATDAGETLEAIFALCKTNIEREIILRRANGDTDAQIAEELGMSLATVFRKRKEIEGRYRTAFE